MASRRRPRPLTQAEVVEAALRIVDDEGLDALTMRRLGAALEVEAMALYRHVRDKNELLDLTVVRMRSEMQIAEPLPEDPAAALEAIFVEYRRVLSAHPNMLPLATRRTDPAAISGLDYLMDHGLAIEDAVELYQSLTAFTVGFAVLGSSNDGWAGFDDQLARRLGRWEDGTFRRTVRQLLVGYGLREQGRNR